ncbi:hypothetical protein PSN45_000322 [Yamadazyma tenuis]|uniref:Uncharacterized protein n=1 Tax=Candida tenuis (strain ATCC 10573 / BCRC 21748 / CBS 615 / JCM 9827 / NBRC 10315 / NRRL Y-1498 / VKM Y-70) TaxID=590646 RepID=G3B7L0_CANTC|nr:uncharacterized protein CANTEDRAFT_98831 [Yamadazyma tenuis ATCC 10573]EGV62595.1 hypothetical protein CANTEDRAFT_98831 [Yamadazyma tenuis ATCC 10573]WEJ92864.1 hypothetical protein PSN45_000322 [Yamadazyma tenuis]
MAPPTPVYDRFDILTRYGEKLDNPDKYQCSLKSLVQSECTFKLSNPGLPPEVICLPFKRLFQRCLVPTTIVQDGKRIKADKWVNIEVTHEHTNRGLFHDPKYDSNVKKFLQAEKDLSRMLQDE